MITVNGMKYHVETYGQGEPVVLLHGFTGSTKSWESLVPILSDDFQVILIDLIGHGKTDKPNDPERYSMKNTVDDIADILKQLNIRVTLMLGYSLGGRTALSFTMNYPEMVMSLILESSSPGLHSTREREERIQNDERLAEKIEQVGVESFIDNWEKIPLFQTQQRLSQDQWEKQRNIRLANSVVGLANSLQGMGTGRQPSWWDKLSSCEIPTLLITGEEDHKFCTIAEEMNERMPNATWEIIPKAGHTTHLENFNFFATIVIEFLQNRKDGKHGSRMES